MDQPVPRVTAADVERIVRRDFAPDDFALVISILNEYGTETWQPETDRVRLAVLKLAAGDKAAVRREIEQAKTDYRDVLAPAEYPAYSQHLTPPTGKQQQTIFQADWQQYEKWLKGGTGGSER